jgi:predicted dehydrogenase
MKDKIKVGVIGCGVGRFHLAGYSKLPNVEVMALAGLDEARCQQLAAEYGIPRLFTDYRDLLALPEIDAVSVCVPNCLHAPVATAALAAGKHVLCEKPLAATVAEGEAIVAAARRARRKLMVSFNYRFRGDSQTLQRHIAAGGLGEVYYVKAGWLRRSGIPGIGSWFTCQAEAGGGPLIDLGVHVLDLALWFLGYPEIVAVSGATYAKFGPRGKGFWGGDRFPPGTAGCDVEDLATAFVRLAGGATMAVETSWASYTSAGDDYHVHLFGDEGGAELTVRNYTQKDTLRFFGELAGVPTETRPLYPEMGSHEAAIRHFVECLVEDREPAASGEQGLAVLRLIAAIYQSAATGREVVLADS